MKIGFYIQWNKYSLENHSGNVIGDELLAESYCKYLRKIPEIEDAQLYAPNYRPESKLDVMVYMNPIEPVKEFSDINVLYVQNGFEYNVHSLTRNKGFQGYIFFSQKLLDLVRQHGGSGIFLPFGADLEQFFPQPYEKDYDFDITYVGNDIKGEERTVKYLLPAVNFNFGLFGNWEKPPHTPRRNIFRNIFKIFSSKHKVPKYKTVLHKKSRGKIPQEKVSVLYSSSKINLNFTIQSCVDYDTITLRLFEILACKGFCISDRTPSAEKLLDGCVVFTDGGKDLEEKIKYYLKHPAERAAIAQKGYEYVTKHASIEARLNELYQYLKGLNG